MNNYQLFVIIIASTSICYGKNTPIYEQYKLGLFKDTIYLQNTYLGYDLNPCERITDRRKYVKILEEQGIKCSGSWCDLNGGFSCKTSMANCYNMEHIIDSRNSLSELGEEYDRDILGNLVMAYSKWNQQVGNLPSWNEIKQEKREVYGDIFEKAMFNVKYCYELKNSITEIAGMMETIASAIFIFLIVGFLVILMIKVDEIKKERNSRNEEEVIIEDFTVGLDDTNVEPIEPDEQEV